MLTTLDIRAGYNNGVNLKFLFFYGHTNNTDYINKSCLSQWYPSPFIINGILYQTCEHWMMAEKARLFNDEESEELIINCNTPSEAKSYGRKVKNFDETTWKKKAKQVVCEGNHAKFSQNSKLKEFLTSTKGKILVEASPYDKIWGIGLGENDVRALNPNEWQGENLLGFCLMEVRSVLQNG